MPRAEADFRAAARALLRWYARHARDLPWRRIPDPYRILVSEVMLQQTTVETVTPYFERFVKAYPDFRSLAMAPEEAVLRLWSGLGYYRRARSLLAAARAVVERHAGRLPEEPEALRALPGVGPYTAEALAAFAQHRVAVALDGNLRRVLARLIAFRGDTRSRGGEAVLRRAGVRIVAAGGDPSALNQALMDLGALVCGPRAPDCPRCPLRSRCAARRLGLAEGIPPPRRRRASIGVALQGWIVRRGERVLVRRRRGTLMQGLWEFPLFARDGAAESGGGTGAAASRIAARARGGALNEIGARLGVALGGVERRGIVRHTITHHRVRIEVFEARAARAAAPRGRRVAALASREGPARIAGAHHREDLRWVEAAALPALPLTGMARKILRAASGSARGVAARDT